MEPIYSARMKSRKTFRGSNNIIDEEEKCLKTFGIFKRRSELITNFLFNGFMLTIVLAVSFPLLRGLSTLPRLQKDTRTSRIYSSLTRPIARIARSSRAEFQNPVIRFHRTIMTPLLSSGLARKPTRVSF